MIRKNKLSLITAVALAIGFSVVAASLSTRETRAADTSADAIAVRTIPNPNHYSISRWYESQGFAGSPQSLVVDGYEAIRDGRTVYVAAANIDPAKSLIYTNIYLISYNQDPAPKTVDILGQIISHWKFNENLPASTVVASCSISSLSCATDADCAADQYCAPATAGAVASSCQLKTVKNCLIDSDCPANFFCDSLKAKITRDVKRVGQLEELTEALFAFKQANGRYPYLAAGSYLAGRTMSAWPSWSQSLLPELAVSKSFLDPINRLGACSGYDAKTCWDENAKKFVNNSVGASIPTLPSGSYVFAYTADAQGSNYELCAVLESRGSSLQYRFSPNDPGDSGVKSCATDAVAFGGLTGNTAPKLVETSLIGEPGKEFNGFIKVSDAENNPLTWSLTATSSAGSLNWESSTWQGGPRLVDTSNPYQKKVYATSAGAPGIYNLQLTVNDGRGGILATTLPVTISNQAPFIEADDEEYILNIVDPLTYHFNFFGLNFKNPGVNTPVVTQIDGPKVGGAFIDLLSPTNLLKVPAEAAVKSFSTISTNKYQLGYRGFVSTALKFLQDTSFKYNIKVTDGFGNTASKDFTIKAKVEKPLLDFVCTSTMRFGRDYSCFLGSGRQNKHDITYSVTGIPLGLYFDGRTISGIVATTSSSVATSASTSTMATTSTSTIATTSSSTAAVTYVVKITAVNEYGATAATSVAWNVNTYCGDGIKQNPNTERRGGLYNDGNEECDGLDGIAHSPAESKLTGHGYACQPSVGAVTPYPPDLNQNYCIFKPYSATDPYGSGYCGDGMCQCGQKVGGRCTFENCSNCSDCGICNSKGVGEECVDNTQCYSGFCNVNGVCEQPCLPGCGAGCTTNCDNGASCTSGIQCNSGECIDGTCQWPCVPTCVVGSITKCGGVSDGCGGVCGTAGTADGCGPDRACERVVDPAPTPAYDLGYLCCLSPQDANIDNGGGRCYPYDRCGNRYTQATNDCGSYYCDSGGVCTKWTGTYTICINNAFYYRSYPHCRWTAPDPSYAND